MLSHPVPPRSEADSEFVSHVSHELRTPLTVIREGASLIQDRVLGDVNPRQKEMLGAILESVDRITGILEKLSTGPCHPPKKFSSSTTKRQSKSSSG